MSKTFTCRELMGPCDHKISGDTFMEIIEKGMQHMQSNDLHKEHMKGHSNNTEEDRKEWFSKMQKEFDSRPEDSSDQS